MKRRLSLWLGTTVNGTDGPMGLVRDFYFDDQRWNLRYLVCKLPQKNGGQQVLIPTAHFLRQQWDLPLFPVDLTVAEIGTCPSYDTDMPVSRQRLQNLGEVILWPDQGGVGNPAIVSNLAAPKAKGDPHLRSFATIRQYRVESPNAVLGRIKDFIVDEDTWTVYALVVQLGPWYHPRTVLAAPRWAQDFDWASGCLWTDVHPEDWQKAPEFSLKQTPASPLPSRTRG